MTRHDDMDDAIADLKAAHLAWQKASNAAARERERERDELLTVERNRINALIAAKHDAKVTALCHDEWEAKVALDDAKVAAVWAPTDAVVYEWRNLQSARWARDYKLRLTGRSARFEVVGRATQFATNLARWRRPEPGDIILRILKKDGTPGLQFETWPIRRSGNARWELRDWQPGEPGLAQGIEAQRAETQRGSVADESPTRRDAPATKDDPLESTP